MIFSQNNLPQTIKEIKKMKKGLVILLGMLLAVWLSIIYAELAHAEGFKIETIGTQFNDDYSVSNGCCTAYKEFSSGKFKSVGNYEEATTP